VSLWWCDLGEDDGALEELAEWLSPQEQARARRYGYEALAQRYVRGRAALRWIVGRELGLAPRLVTIERGHRGRPHIPGATIDFNVSNTGNVALVGFTTRPGLRIGVDVESADRRLDHRGLARKFLTVRENAAFAGLDENAQRLAFLRSWTCKEAMSKATGDALSAPLRAIDVELSPGLRLVAGPSPYLAADWRLHAADVPAAFLATIALWEPAASRGITESPAALDKHTVNR